MSTRSATARARAPPEPITVAMTGTLSRAIADTMLKMARLSVPVIATVIGEGEGSARAALAVADRVLMQENATYSVITPEGCAAILWRDAAFASQAAEALKPTASHLLELGAVSYTHLTLPTKRIV